MGGSGDGSTCPSLPSVGNYWIELQAPCFGVARPWLLPVFAETMSRQKTSVLVVCVCVLLYVSAFLNTYKYKNKYFQKNESENITLEIRTILEGMQENKHTWKKKKSKESGLEWKKFYKIEMSVQKTWHLVSVSNHHWIMFTWAHIEQVQVYPLRTNWNILTV